MAAGTSVLLFVILLGLSHLLCLNAVPSTRIGSLMHESKVHQVPENTHLVNKLDDPKAITKESLEIQQLIERIDVEVNDYPGSGANNRHTPRLPPSRGCSDC